jgi:hypothetical protein
LTDCAAELSRQRARLADMTEESVSNEHIKQRSQQREMTLLQIEILPALPNSWYRLFGPASGNTVALAS